MNGSLTPAHGATLRPEPLHLCRACDGWKWIGRASAPTRCPVCRGTGTITEDRRL